MEPPILSFSMSRMTWSPVTFLTNTSLLLDRAWNFSDIFVTVNIGEEQTRLDVRTSKNPLMWYRRL